jgi:hypothetical protein
MSHGEFIGVESTQPHSPHDKEALSETPKDRQKGIHAASAAPPTREVPWEVYTGN